MEGKEDVSTSRFGNGADAGDRGVPDGTMGVDPEESSRRPLQRGLRPTLGHLFPCASHLR